LDVKYEVARDVKLEPETGMGNVNATGRNTEGKRQGIRNGFLEVSTVNTPFYPSIMPPVPPWSALLCRCILHRNFPSGGVHEIVAWWANGRIKSS
jgi:hypothetical protein